MKKLTKFRLDELLSEELRTIKGGSGITGTASSTLSGSLSFSLSEVDIDYEMETEYES